MRALPLLITTHNTRTAGLTIGVFDNVPPQQMSALLFHCAHAYCRANNEIICHFGYPRGRELYALMLTRQATSKLDGYQQYETLR